MSAEARLAQIVRAALDLPGSPGERLYDYALPDGLHVGIGDGVVVPFGARRAVGIVVACDTTPPEGILVKPLESRIGEKPILSLRVMQLAQEIADYWAAPLSITLRSLLPPGLLDKVERMVRITAAASAEGRSAANRLGIGEEWTRVDRLAGARGTSRPAILRQIRALTATGEIEGSWHLAATGARSVSEEFVALAKTSSDELPRLGARQAAAYAALKTAADLGGEGIPARSLPGGLATARRLTELGLATIDVRRRERVHAERRSGRADVATAIIEWSPEQHEVIGIAAQQGAHITLVDGAPGSGKSRAAVEAAARVIATGRSVLWLVPETSHASLALDLLQAASDAPIEIVHSGMSQGERLDAYDRLAESTPHIVVGTRIAVGAINDAIGLIVMDEEHESGYKSDRTPRLHAREVACMLARLHAAPLMLLSATPSIESLARATREGWGRITLSPRAAAPKVEVVDLRQELEDGWRGMVSRSLLAHLRALDWSAGAQALLIINRRGLASALLCRDCGAAQSCPSCERPLILHSAGSLLRCHGCGLVAEPLTRCPSCNSARIRPLGGGTEKLEAEIRTLFPDQSVDRLDADAAAPIGAADRILDRFRSGATQILIGTALAAKSLNLPNLALVGIVSADTGLLLPDERAAERTVAFIVQAVGRLGRGSGAGHAVIQSYRPEDPAILAAVQIARGGSVAAWREIEVLRRQQAGGAPFLRTAKLTATATTATGARRAAEALHASVSERTAGDATVRLYGPVPAWIPRRAGRWREQVILRCADPLPIVNSLTSRDVSIDLDPETLL